MNSIGIQPTNDPGRAFVSVIMPIRNEAGFIHRSLGAVLGQDYPSDRMEVLIADGRSTDATRKVIEQISKAHPGITVSIVDNPEKIVPTGFNRALAQAKGEVIVRVDGHTIIAPDYIQQCVAALERSGADNVGGRMEAVSEGYFGKAVALATSSPFGVGGARFHYSNLEECVDTVYMGTWPRSVFDRVGLFDEEQVRNQDDEFNYRLLSQGGKILLSPRIRSKYYNRSTLRSLWKQYFQYGYWKVRVMQKHPRQMRSRQFVPPLFVAVLSLFLILAPFSTLGIWGLIAVAGSYIAANLAASAISYLRVEEGPCLSESPKDSEATQTKRNWRAMAFLPLAFATLHIAYGLGFLTGLVRFWNRWKDRENRRSDHAALPV